MAAIFNQPGIRQFQAAMVSCHTDDTYESLWTNIFRRLERDIQNFTPEGVRYEVERLDPPALIHHQEFGSDRNAEDGAR